MENGPFTSDFPIKTFISMGILQPAMFDDTGKVATKTITGWWYTYPSEKYESIGMIIISN